jgi:micrococcal nuclease
MLKTIALSIVTAGLLAAADPIPSAEAKNHVGETGKVCGKVADTRYLDGGGRRPTFLNFDKKFPDHTFTAVIFGDDRAKFGEPEKEYLEKDVCVSGKIENYNGKPQIILTEKSQIEKK